MTTIRREAKTTSATFDTGYPGGRHWLPRHWLPHTGYLYGRHWLPRHWLPDTGYPQFATPGTRYLQNTPLALCVVAGWLLTATNSLRLLAWRERFAPTESKWIHLKRWAESRFPRRKGNTNVRPDSSYSSFSSSFKKIIVDAKFSIEVIKRFRALLSFLLLLRSMQLPLQILIFRTSYEIFSFFHWRTNGIKINLLTIGWRELCHVKNLLRKGHFPVLILLIPKEINHN